MSKESSLYSSYSSSTNSSSDTETGEHVSTHDSEDLVCTEAYISLDMFKDIDLTGIIFLAGTILTESSDIGHVEKCRQGNIEYRKVIQKFLDSRDQDIWIKEFIVSVYTKLFKNTGAYFAQNKIDYDPFNTTEPYIVLSKKIRDYITIRDIILRNYNNIKTKPIKVEYLHNIFTPGNKVKYNNKEYTIDFDSLAIVMIWILLTVDIDGIGFGLLNLGFVPDDKNLTLKAAKIDYGHALADQILVMESECYLTDSVPQKDFGKVSYSTYLDGMKKWIKLDTNGKPSFNSEALFPVMLHVDVPENQCLYRKPHDEYGNIMVSTLNLFQFIDKIPTCSVQKALNAVMAVEQKHINSLYRSVVGHFDMVFNSNKIVIKVLELFTKMFSLNVKTFKKVLDEQGIELELSKTKNFGNLCLNRVVYSKNYFRGVLDTNEIPYRGRTNVKMCLIAK